MIQKLVHFAEEISVAAFRWKDNENSCKNPKVRKTGSVLKVSSAMRNKSSREIIQAQNTYAQGAAEASGEPM